MSRHSAKYAEACEAAVRLRDSVVKIDGGQKLLDDFASSFDYVCADNALAKFRTGAIVGSVAMFAIALVAGGKIEGGFDKLLDKIADKVCGIQTKHEVKKMKERNSKDI